MVQPCPCGLSVPAAVGPGRLFPLGLELNLPPDSSSPPDAGEEVWEQTGRAGTALRVLTLWQRAWGSRKG